MLIGQTNEISFHVNVMGTAAEPKVKVFLSTSPELSFPAHKQGDEWKASVKIPANTEPGAYYLRVEVYLNSRHFTPLSKTVELIAPISKQEEPIISPAAQIEVPLTPPGIEAPAVTEAPREPHVQELLLEVPPKKIKIDSSIFKVENLRAPSAPVKLNFQPIIARDLPIDAAPPTEEAVTKTKRKNTKKITLEHKLPIRLVKGKIIYE